MKKCKMWIIAVLVAMLVSACGGRNATGGADPSGPSWQEQYDLGVRYLSEGNYQEAILAFTAAIEIDPKRAPAYVGRGDAYVRSGETEKNLAVARTDYERAIELDETLLDAYLKLAEVYQKQGDEEAAKQILQQGVDITKSEELQHQIDELTKLKPKEGYPKTERREHESGGKYTVTEYDEYGQQVSFTTYYADNSIEMQNIYKYDEWGNQIYLKHYSAVTYLSYADPSYTYEIYFDQSHRVIEKNSNMTTLEENVKYDYSNCPTVIISAHIIDTGFIFTEKHQDLSFTITYQMQNEENTVVFTGCGGSLDGSQISYSIEENDTDGKAMRKTDYRADGTVKWYTEYTWTDSGLESKRYDANGVPLS